MADEIDLTLSPVELTRATNVAMEFVKAINKHELEWVNSMMDDKHRFYDSVGNSISGKENMAQAWENYFRMFPDYTISVDQMIWDEDQTVVLLGHARGTYVSTKGHRTKQWQIPAAFRVVISGKKVQEWQVYADNEPVRALVEAAESGP